LQEAGTDMDILFKNYEKILPIAIMVLSFGASFVYLYKHDYKHFLYWFSAGMLNVAVTI
jgi:hypothetical protein